MKRSKVVLWTTLSLTALMCLAGCGDVTDDGPGASNNDTECRAPTGTYTEEVVEASGDCPSGLVDEVTGSRDVSLSSEDADCGVLRSNYSETVETDSGVTCTVEGEFEADIVDEGIENGGATLDVNCSDGSTCSHQFNVYYTKR